MSKLNKPLFVVGLADRIDGKHRRFLIDHADLFRTTIIIAMEETFMNEDIFDGYYKPLSEIVEDDMFT